MIPADVKTAILKFIASNPGTSIEEIRLQLLLAPRDVQQALKELEADVERWGTPHRYRIHNAHPIEKWYTGKALELVRSYVLPTLEQAQKDGFWPKGASRKVIAALNKQAVANRFARSNDRDRNQREENCSGRLDDVCDNREHWWEAKLKGSEFVFAMEFGSVSRAPALVELGPKLEALCVNDAERAALATARQWAADFAPVAELVRLLDSRRTPPTIVLGSLSPTVAKQLGDVLGVRFETIAMPPIKRYWRKVTVKGVETEIAFYVIEWPEGTLHGRSKFCQGSKAGNDQCQACGHAIKSPYNWVPLLAEGAAGKLSFWVGRDCARKLFKVDVKGDGQFDRSGAK